MENDRKRASGQHREPSHLSEEANEPNSTTFLYITNFKDQFSNSMKGFGDLTVPFSERMSCVGINVCVLQNLC